MKGWVALFALIAVAALVAACGSSGSSDTSSSSQPSSTAAATSANDPVAEAKKRIQPYLGVPTFDAAKFKPAAPPFDASKAKGKVIFDIPISSALPFIKGIDEGQKQAADAVGAKYITFPNQGTVAEWVKGFDQAIARKVDLIVLDAAPNPAQLQPQLKAAKAAGIPVLATHMPLDSEFPAGSLPKTNLANVTAVVPGPFPQASRLQADYAVANTPKGDVHALIITSNEVAASRGIVQMTQDELKSVCPNCKTTVVNVPLNDWATKLQSSVQSALLKDPTINWVIPIYDSMSQFAVPGITAAQKTGKVRVATFNGTAFVMKMVQDKDVVAMDIGESLNWLGWAFMDQAFRVVSGEKPVAYTTAPTPLRIWDDANISEAGNPPKDSTGYGDGYIPGYKKLWGLTG